MREYLIKYFQEKNLEFKEATDEQFVLKTCISCGDDKGHHFYMGQEEGLWDCKKCSAKGNFNQFRKLMGDSEIDLAAFQNKKKDKVKKAEYKQLQYTIPIQYASRLWATEERYQKYLTEERGLNEKILKEFKVGTNGKAITIPVYENDVLVNIQYRRDPALDDSDNTGPRYSNEKGCKAALFNGDILKDPIKQVYICEGMFDALYLIQLGYRNVVSVPLGAGYFSKEWVDKLKDVQTIYLLYDNDQAGKDGAKNAANMIGVDRCKVITLPRKEGRKKTDVTEYFVVDNYTKTDFLELVKDAKVIRSVEADSIKHISEFNEDLRKRLIDGELLGESTGFPLLDDAMGGLRKGRLVVVSGLTSTGKTSFALSVGLKLADRKIPTFFFSLEMPPIDIAKKALIIKSKLTNLQLKDIKEPSKELDIVDTTLKGFSNITDMPMYLYSGSGVVQYKILADCARIVKEEFGVEHIFVDHLHYFARSSHNITAETSQVVRDLKQLAVHLDITIILLAHLNRAGRASQKKGLYTPALSDLRDSGSIEQDADQVLFVCRDSESDEQAEREKAFIKVAKNRDGGSGRNISMKFDESLTTFIETDASIDYAQEDKEDKEDKSSEVLKDDTTLPF